MGIVFKSTENTLYGDTYHVTSIYVDDQFYKEIGGFSSFSDMLNVVGDEIKSDEFKEWIKQLGGNHENNR